MRTKIYVSGIVVVLAALLLVVLPVGAQGGKLSAEDQVILDVVITAFDNFRMLESYSSEATQSMEQMIVVGRGASQTTVEQSFDQQVAGRISGAEGESLAAEITIEQVIIIDVPGSPLTDTSQTIEMVIANDNLYVRFSDVTPLAVAAIYPTEWVNVSREPGRIPGFEVLNIDQFVNVLSTLRFLPLNNEVVIAITELPSETVDEREMRVFDVVFDAALLFATPEVAQGMGLMNAEQLGVDIDSFLEIYSHNTTLEMTLWVGVEDSMIYRADTITELANADFGDTFGTGQSLSMSQSLVNTTFYGDFDAAFKIAAPIND